MHDFERSTHPGEQEAYLLCGLPGSGKTTFARKYLDTPKLQRFSIDEAMYQRHGVYDVDYPNAIYKELEREVYKELDRELMIALHAGASVLLDYGFWTRYERDKYRGILTDHSVKIQKLLYFKANQDILRARLNERNRKVGANALSVDNELFERMHRKFEEPRGEGEIVIDAEKDFDDMTVDVLGANNIL